MPKLVGSELLLPTQAICDRLATSAMLHRLHNSLRYAVKSLNLALSAPWKPTSLRPTARTALSSV